MGRWCGVRGERGEKRGGCVRTNGMGWVGICCEKKRMDKNVRLRWTNFCEFCVSFACCSAIRIREYTWFWFSIKNFVIFCNMLLKIDFRSAL
jgi:hypothetical protein